MKASLAVIILFTLVSSLLVPATALADGDNVDVLQCRVQSSTGAFSGDRCPHAGGIDQNIYGASAP